jgi:hypothetical protein
MISGTGDRGCRIPAGLMTIRPFPCRDMHGRYGTMGGEASDVLQ